MNLNTHTQKEPQPKVLIITSMTLYECPIHRNLPTQITVSGYEKQA